MWLIMSPVVLEETLDASALLAYVEQLEQGEQEEVAQMPRVRLPVPESWWKLIASKVSFPIQGLLPQQQQLLPLLP